MSEFYIFNVSNECVSKLEEMCVIPDLFPSTNEGKKWCICCEPNKFYDSYDVVPFSDEEYDSIVTYSKEAIANNKNLRSNYYIIDHVFADKAAAVTTITDLRNGYARLRAMRKC